MAAAPKVGARFRDCARCPEMVVVPAGSFLMGSPKSEKGHSENEGPVHRVRIAAPFAVGVYEVTFEEWDACEEDGGCRRHEPKDMRWGRGRRPVINVSWEDAQAAGVCWLADGEDGEALPSAERIRVGVRGACGNADVAAVGATANPSSAGTRTAWMISGCTAGPTAGRAGRWRRWHRVTMGIRPQRRSALTRRTLGVCMMFWAMCGNGRRTVGMSAMRVRRRMGAHGKAAAARAAFCAAALVATYLGSLSAPRSALETPPATATVFPGSVWPGRSPHEPSPP